MGTAGADDVGAFLRARRGAVTPARVGFPADHGRRVQGLRREEVAVLAGMSVDYYVRLEQGRARPSEQVLEALARALLLDDDQREHLRHLARPSTGAAARRTRPASLLADRTVRPSVQRLVDAMPTCPAFVMGRRTEVLACNALGAALHGDPLRHPPDHRAMAWLLFLDPATRDLYPQWELVARDTVGALRHDAARHPDDPTLTRLVGELGVRDGDFRRWWTEHHVHVKKPGVKTFRHPVVGTVTLDHETLHVAGTPDQRLVVYSAAPGTPAAEALTLLGTWQATRERAATPE